MTPFISSLNDAKQELVPICLSKNTAVNSTHSGRFPIPLGSLTLVKTLVVLSIHEPLLLILSMCNEGLTVCFDDKSCQIFSTSDVPISGSEMGAGYTRGNLFYLPSELDVRFPFSIPVCLSINSFSAAVNLPNSTLLNFHRTLSHIGMQPLKTLL
jgi:hypothetical protein